MKHHINSSLLILSLLIGSCSPKVIEFLNDDMDFSDYKTYRLINFKLDDKAFSIAGKEYFDSVEFAINRNMKGKSFQPASSNSDLVVRYEIITTVKTQSSVQKSNYYDPYSYYRPVQSTDVYQEGVLLIEFLDRRKKKLVWQASLDIRYPKNKDKAAITREAIDKVFSTYPYSAGSNKREVEI